MPLPAHVTRNQPRVVIRDAATSNWLDFSRPNRVWKVTELDGVLPALVEIEAAVQQSGLTAAGFIAYEAAPAFDVALPAYAPDAFPLLWFGLFDPPHILTELPGSTSAQLETTSWQSSISPDAYRSGFEIIKAAISQGHTYQVNLTHRLFATLKLPAWDVFTQLVRNGDQPYSAFIELEDWAICSASPELFFELDGDQIESVPMKGTAGRGLWPDADEHQARALATSEKERAENLMIVDMVRNDLGRIAVTGSVRVPALFKVERFRTAWQMVSRVSAKTQASITDIFTALFPPASITGAPKKSTMEIIRRIESTPRHIYTGAIGFIAPGRKARFNVAIRTILIHTPDGQAEYGVGGGIVWDSDCEREQEECRIKARILSQTRPTFDLFESLLWDDQEGYWLLDEHLQRLEKSADYFSFPIQAAELRAVLEKAAQTFGKKQKVRLFLTAEGEIRLEARELNWTIPLEPVPMPLALQPVHSDNVFLYHKTTQRQVYERALRERPGSSDVMLFNQHGELTESCTANVIVEIDGQLYTPPISSGLLAGTHRARLLAAETVSERVIALDEALGAQNLWLINSVRGKWPVRLVDGIH